MSGHGNFNPGTVRRQVKLLTPSTSTSSDRPIKPNEIISVASISVRMDVSKCFSWDGGDREFMLYLGIGDNVESWYINAKTRTIHNQSLKGVEIYENAFENGEWKKQRKLAETKIDKHDGIFVFDVRLPTYKESKINYSGGPLPVAMKIVEVDRGGKAFNILGKIISIGASVPFPGSPAVGLFGSLISFASVFFDDDVEISYNGSIHNPMISSVYRIVRSHGFSSMGSEDIALSFSLSSSPGLVDQPATSATALLCSAFILPHEYGSSVGLYKKKRIDHGEIIIWGRALIKSRINGQDGTIFCPFSFNLQRSNRYARASDLNSVTNLVIFNSFDVSSKKYVFKPSPKAAVLALDARTIEIPDLRSPGVVTIEASALLLDVQKKRLIDGAVGLALALPAFGNDWAGLIATSVDIVRGIHHDPTESSMPSVERTLFSVDPRNGPIEWKPSDFKEVFPYKKSLGSDAKHTWFAADELFGHQVKLVFFQSQFNVHNARPHL